ncbi:hypothetical protein ACLB2K_044303 [Fragaria x ananassa]
MRNQLLLQLPFVLILIFIVSFKLTHAKSTIEPCTSSDSCPSLLSYVLPWDSKLSEIAYRFQVNVFDVMAANSINITASSVGNQIFGARSQLKVPISCSCVDGIRRVMLSYIVRAADSLDLISEGYGRLVSGEQLGTLNGISPNNPLTSGQSILVQLPCTCFNNSNNGVASVFMSYVVQSGESLSNIGVEFGAIVKELVGINGLDQPTVDPGDIMAIPISACSSANLNWYNESLIVPNGSYALTASNCIKCICRPSTLNLQCFPSGIVNACSHLQCKGSNLFIGDVSINRTATGCNVSTCVYRGHNGGKIFRGLLNSSHSHCSDDEDYSIVSPVASPENPTVPYISLPPSQSPFPNRTIGTDAYGPSSRLNPSSAPKYGRLVSEAPYYSLWVVLCLFF